jgi:hypothetical protein
VGEGVGPSQVLVFALYATEKGGKMGGCVFGGQKEGDRKARMARANGCGRRDALN